MDNQGEVVVTTNEQGECILVSRQDEEHNILSVIWEKPHTPELDEATRIAQETGQYGDALAALDELEFLEMCAARGADGSMREAAINSVSVIRRHLTASGGDYHEGFEEGMKAGHGMPYMPEEAKQVLDRMRRNRLEYWVGEIERALAAAPKDGRE